MVSWKSHTRDTYKDHLSLPSRSRLGAIFHPRREKKARETWDRLNHSHSAHQQHDCPTPIHSTSDPEAFVYIDPKWGAEQMQRRAAHRHPNQTRVYAPPSHRHHRQNAHYVCYQPQPPPSQHLDYSQTYQSRPQHVYAQQLYYGLPQQAYKPQHASRRPPQQRSATQHVSHKSPQRPYKTQNESHSAPQHEKKQPRENKKRKECSDSPKAGYGAQPSGPSAAEVMLAGGYTTSLMDRYPHRALY